MRQSGLKYDNLDRYVLHTAILSPLILLTFVFSSTLVICTHFCRYPLFLRKRITPGHPLILGFNGVPGLF